MLAVLYEIGDSSAPVVVAIALTSTALGTLLPILAMELERRKLSVSKPTGV